MYSPEAFKVEDRAIMHAFLRQHNFATLVTQHDGGLQATHVPLVLKEEVGGKERCKATSPGRIRSGVISRPAERCS